MLHESVLDLLATQSVIQQHDTLTKLTAIFKAGTEQGDDLRLRLAEMNRNMSNLLFTEASIAFAEEPSAANLKEMTKLAAKLHDDYLAAEDDD